MLANISLVVEEMQCECVDRIQCPQICSSEPILEEGNGHLVYINNVSLTS
jgi:hypothetical protein